MYTTFKLTNSDDLIPAHNTPRKTCYSKKSLQNLNVVFAVVTPGHTTMARVLLRAKSVMTAPNTTILPVCVTPKIKSENNSTRIPPMQYVMIFDCHIPITTETAAVTKAPTATRIPLLLIKSKASPTQERNNARSMQTWIKIGKSTIPLQIDSASSVNIGETTFHQ